MDRVENILKKRANAEIFQTSFVCYKAQEIFNKQFGKDDIKVIAWHNHQLKINIKNKYLATEIKIKQKQILEQINNSLGKILVKKIVIK